MTPRDELLGWTMIVITAALILGAAFGAYWLGVWK